METKQANLKDDMAFGQIVMIVATPEEDAKENTDLFWRGLRVAWRRRRYSVKKFGEISIRNNRYTGTMTEKEKIINGNSKAQLYIQEFKDAYVVCLVKDIKRALIEGKGRIKPNTDNKTEAIYLSINDLPTLIIDK